MKLSTGLLVIGMCLTSFTAADAATILRHEPPQGKLPAGETVLVDNGQCGHGKVQAVTAGTNRSLRSGNRMGGSHRTYKCVVRPAG